MSINLLMPKLGLTMSEGKISKWYKQVGDRVEVGDPLFDVETDKLTNTIEAYDEGYLRAILVEEGIDVPVSELVGVITASMDDELDLEGLGQEAPKKDKKPESPEKKEDHQEDSPSSDKKKVIVIGGGPGGYVAAIRLAQLGADVSLIEKNKLGGSCLNVGCIPTKVLLRTSQLYDEILLAEELGIEITGEKSVNWTKLQDRKEGIVNRLTSGTESLLRANGVNIIEGHGSLVDKNTVNILKSDGDKEVLKADNIILATGSSSFIPPIKGVDLEGIMTSDEALSLEELPASIAIVGGGVIGIEFGSIFNSLGVDVTIIEMMPDILMTIDGQIRTNVRLSLESKGIDINTSSKVNQIEKKGEGYLLSFEKDGKLEEVEAEKVLVSSGRIPYLENLGLKEAGIKHDRAVEVNDHMQTNLENVYAIGDLTAKNLLAHVAIAQAMVAAENIMGGDKKMSYKAIPSCIYISPEIASIGMTEDEAKKQGLDYEVGIFNLSGNGKAVIMGQTEATMVKIISEKKYDEVIGAHIYGPNATELINEFSLGMRLETTVDEIMDTVHAHPTVAESIGEASMAVKKLMIHGINR